MTSYTVEHIETFLNQEIEITKRSMDNAIGNDDLNKDKLIRLSTRIHTLKSVLLYFSKED